MDMILTTLAIVAFALQMVFLMLSLRVRELLSDSPDRCLAWSLGFAVLCQIMVCLRFLLL